MCAGRPGARRFRQWLSEGARALGVGLTSAFEASRLLREGAALCVETDA
jgi:hypothetical protein